MDVVTYRRCRYDGGFVGMKSSPKATLTVSTDRLTLRRPRVLLGGRKTNIMKIWASWSAVIDLDIRASRDGTRVVFTTRSRGTARVVVPGVEPLEVWRALDRVDDLRDRIPPRVRKALDGEGTLSNVPVEDEDETGDGLEELDVTDGPVADADPATVEEGAEEAEPEGVGADEDEPESAEDGDLGDEGAGPARDGADPASD